MIAQAQVQAGFWLDQDEQDRFLSRLKRTLFLSLALHVVVLLIATGLRLPQRGERPLASVEVTLVSLPAPVKQTETAKKIEPPRPLESKAAPAPPVPMRDPAPQEVEPAVAKVAPAAKSAPSIQLPAPIIQPPSAAPAFTPARTSSAKDILKDLELPPDAPKFGELTPTKSVAQPQAQAQTKFKVPDLPRIPEVAAEPSLKAPPQQASIREDVDRELENELKKIKEFRPAARIEAPKDVPMKPLPPVEASAPVVKAPQTTLRTSGSSGTNPFWARVEAIIRSQWEPPPIDVTGSSYSVVVKFRFFRNGTVKDVGVQQTSGNSYFDDAGRRAILKPRQYPQFPAEMPDPYQDVEMIFRVGEVTG